MMIHTLILLLCTVWTTLAIENPANESTTIDLGVIMDFGTLLGIVSNSTMQMALADFNADPNQQAQLVLHPHRSHGSITGAAKGGLRFMTDSQVQAIIGPQTSEQADFLSYMGTEAHVPIVSFSALSSLLSPTKVPYFVRMAQNDSTQARAIADVVHAYRWREVVLVHDDSDSGTSPIPYITDALQEIDVRVSRRVILPYAANKTTIHDHLRRLAGMGTRVFIVHMSFRLGQRFFMRAYKARMMTKGYVWIITSGLANLLPHMNSSVVDSMQGVLGVKNYVPESTKLETFRARWKEEFRRDHPNIEISELDVYALWAYDTVWAVAMAVDRINFGSNKSPHLENSSTMGLDVSPVGPELLESLMGYTFIGLSGEVRLVDGQLQSPNFEIVNVIGNRGRTIGYWTPKTGLSRSMDMDKNYSASMDDLQGVIWPGESTAIPRGWVHGRKLQIGIPVKTGFSEFMKVDRDPKDNRPIPSGFPIDVFNGVMTALPYPVSYEFSPFENGHEGEPGYYNELVYQVYLKKYDAVVGDTTIIANRSNYVDFTHPYAESGVSMIVPIENDDVTRSFWWFTKPMTMKLWVITIILFVANGTLVWYFESRNNNEDFLEPSNDPRFQTAWKKYSERVGKILFYSLSLFVFAQRERVQTNYARLVVVAWTFLVFILVTSYTANLTSMLTVEKLRPSITDVELLVKRGDYVGYPNGSFVLELLKNMGFKEEKLRPYATVEDYAEALSRGSSNNGVSAIIDEIPYIRVFLASYCHKYTMAGRTYRTGGFGFVFPKGFDMLPDINKAVLEFSEGEGMYYVEKKWFGHGTLCPQPLETPLTYNRFPVESFRSVYIIAGGASGLAILVFLIRRRFRRSSRLQRLLRKFRAVAHFIFLRRRNPAARPLRQNRGDESSSHGTAESSSSVQLVGSHANEVNPSSNGGGESNLMRRHVSALEANGSPNMGHQEIENHVHP